MNILYLNTTKSDYSQDILYAGLRKRSDISLYEYPFNKYYHLPIKKYPRNLGYRSGGLLKALLGAVPWGTIDVVVIAGCSPGIGDLYLKLKSRLRSGTPLVFVDGGDWEAIGGDFQRMSAGDAFERLQAARPFDLVFKREMIIGKEYPQNTRPFPFGFNLERVPRTLPQQKKYDVSFWAVESHPIRTDVLRIMEDRFDCRSNGSTMNQEFSKYKRKGAYYLQELAACRIVLNFRGAGWDTLRYWETPAVGAFMLSQQPGIVIPDNFRQGQEAVFCKDDLSDLVELCRYYLDHETERETIAKHGAEWLRKYHSEDARAAYFLGEIRKIIA
jgi:hypothetical protein